MKKYSLITIAVIATLLISLKEIRAAERSDFRAYDQMTHKNLTSGSPQLASETTCEMDEFLYPLIGKSMCQKNDQFNFELSSVYQNDLTKRFQETKK